VEKRMKLKRVFKEMKTANTPNPQNIIKSSQREMIHCYRENMIKTMEFLCETMVPERGSTIN
jgi:hypothetical protein